MFSQRSNNVVDRDGICLCWVSCKACLDTADLLRFENSTRHCNRFLRIESSILIHIEHFEANWNITNSSSHSKIAIYTLQIDQTSLVTPALPNQINGSHAIFCLAVAHICRNAKLALDMHPVIKWCRRSFLSSVEPSKDHTTKRCFLNFDNQLERVQIYEHGSRNHALRKTIKSKT